jgi:hypothetical protein
VIINYYELFNLNIAFVGWIYLRGLYVIRTSVLSGAEPKDDNRVESFSNKFRAMESDE